MLGVGGWGDVVTFLIPSLPSLLSFPTTPTHACPQFPVHHSCVPDLSHPGPIPFPKLLNTFQMSNQALPLSHPPNPFRKAQIQCGMSREQAMEASQQHLLCLLVITPRDVHRPRICGVEDLEKKTKN